MDKRLRTDAAADASARSPRTSHHGDHQETSVRRRTLIAAPVETAVPAPQLRERVLAACRAEMATRREMAPRRPWRWAAVATVLVLLLLNAAEDRRSAARIAALMGSETAMARVTTPSPGFRPIASSRAMLLAALRRDPNAL